MQVVRCMNGIKDATEKYYWLEWTLEEVREWVPETGRVRTGEIGSREERLHENSKTRYLFLVAG